MSEVVLGASALLTLLNREPGHEEVAGTIPHAAISAVNLSEVVAKLAETGMPEEAIREALEGLALEVHTFERELAYETGLLRPTTKSRGLSLCRSGVPQVGKSARTNGIHHGSSLERIGYKSRSPASTPMTVRYG